MANETIEVLRIPGTLFPRGAFDENASYKFLNFVESGGNGYVCLQPCTGIPVTNTAYWFKFVFKGEKGDAFTYADLTAAQKAELVRDATAAAQAAASSAQSAADDAAAALQKFNTIKAAIDAIDPQSTEGSIQTLAAKQGLLESGLNALGPKIGEIKSTIKDISRATTSEETDAIVIQHNNVPTAEITHQQVKVFGSLKLNNKAVLTEDDQLTAGTNVTIENGVISAHPSPQIQEGTVESTDEEIIIKQNSQDTTKLNSIGISSVGFWLMNGYPLKPIRPSVHLQLFGDSITDNTWGDTKTWVNLIPNYLGGVASVSVINSAVGGASLVNTSAASVFRVMQDGYTRESDSQEFLPLQAATDFVVVMAGTNDWNAGTVDIGSFGSTNLREVYGVIPAIVEYVCSRGKKLLICTPTRRHAAREDEWEVDERGERLNSRGYTLRQFVDAIIDCCQFWGIPYIDMYRELGWNDHNIANYTSNDYLHPNLAGDTEISNLICQKIYKMLV